MLISRIKYELLSTKYFLLQVKSILSNCNVNYETIKAPRLQVFPTFMAIYHTVLLMAEFYLSSAFSNKVFVFGLTLLFSSNEVEHMH